VTPPTTTDAPAPVALPIDPRIRQRRRQVRKAEGRRRLKLAIAGACVVLLPVLGWALTRSSLLDVDHVRLRGATHTTLADAAAAAGIHRGRAMTDVDEGGAAHRLDRLPWVARARVHRAWPGTVVIDVVERAPVATVPAGRGMWAIVDATGRVLTPVLLPPPDRPMLLGLGPPGPAGSRLDAPARPLLDVAAALPTALAARITAIAPADGGELTLALRPQGAVRFGPPDRLGDKFAAIESVLAQVDLRRLATLDVRVPASPVLTRQ